MKQKTTFKFIGSDVWLYGEDGGLEKKVDVVGPTILEVAIYELMQVTCPKDIPATLAEQICEILPLITTDQKKVAEMKWFYEPSLKELNKEKDDER